MKKLILHSDQVEEKTQVDQARQIMQKRTIIQIMQYV